MTEQELAEIERKLTHVATALYEGDSHAVNVLELSRLAGDLFGEVRRLQGQLEEAYQVAGFMYGIVGLAICHVGGKAFIPVSLEANFGKAVKVMKGWIDDGP